MKKNVVSKILAGILAAVMVFALAACGKDDEGSSAPSSSTPGSSTPSSSDTQQSQEADPGLLTQITFSGPSANTHTSTEAGYAITQKLIDSLSDYVGVPLVFDWRSDSDYYDALTLRLIANDLPDVLVAGTGNALSSTFITAAEQGMFWDVGPYIDDYDNLATIPEITRLASSYNGKMYGIPRSRDIGRNGFGYRLDWLDNLGLKEPETWDDFKNMLYQFTNGDPDGNGKNDTVGLGLDQWDGAWDIMMTWFGVPDTWGIDANGDLIHKTQTPEFKEALKEFRDLYQQGLINNGANGIPDYKDESMTGGKARTALWYTGLAGAGVQVIDDLRKVNDNAINEGLWGATEDKMVFQMASYLDTGKGPLVLGYNAGMNGYLAISTKNVKTEAQLRQVLDVLNSLNDGAALNLIEYGWENVTYELDENGYVVQWTGDDYADKRAAAGVDSTNWNQGFNQITNYFTADSNPRPVVKAPATAAQQLRQAELYKAAIPYVVTNYGQGYDSETWATMGDQLNTNWRDAMNKYIRGEIDEAGLDAQLEAVMTQGLKQVTDEINALYHAAGH